MESVLPTVGDVNTRSESSGQHQLAQNAGESVEAGVQNKYTTHNAEVLVKSSTARCSCPALLSRTTTLTALSLVTFACTCCAALVAFFLARPSLCSSSEPCWQNHLDAIDARWYSSYVAVVLGGLLLYEFSSLVCAYKNSKIIALFIKGYQANLFPPALLCATFIVLITENVLLYSETVRWFVHVSDFGADDPEHQPVYTIFYMEWCITVPILLVLGGHISLSRPVNEVAEPVVVTNVYMVLAWLAQFISNGPLRVIAVVAIFLMYFRASYLMFKWIAEWRSSRGVSSILGRPILTAMLVVTFAVYGVIYLCKMFEVIGAVQERIWYTTMNACSKLFTLMVFVAIRASDSQELSLTMIANTQTSFQREMIDERHTEVPSLDSLPELEE
eukprot:TRINITY_DN75378_c0_g1_i1.p1 TRINITY_DN75378_c0_g1~~TRINITY_DN75378_c0_g1_i1.p1  ORF type:complete len:388 (+),score=44.48 TRINITY_DN75378_c0_g1_i1:51-1214(+)